MGENLYDLMLNPLYSRVANAERLVQNAHESVKLMDNKSCAKKLSVVLAKTWKDRVLIDELNDSLDTRLLELLHNDEPDPDDDKKGAIEDLIGLVSRTDKIVNSMDSAISAMIRIMSESIERTDREIDQLELKFEKTEELLKRERDMRMSRAGSLSGGGEEG